MRVIPALDLAGGQALLARGGRRDAYAPVRSVLLGTEARAGDALALLRAFREKLGCPECYVADLDAIAGQPLQHALLRRLARGGNALWVDAGVTDARHARELLGLGAVRVVVGLETLTSFAALGDVVAAAGAARITFSLDLRAGQPIVRSEAELEGTPLALARAAVEAGVSSLLVVDLARVGSGQGVDPVLVGSLRGAHPATELVAGGGVKGPQDLAELADLGLDAVLVATALHAGRIDRAAIEAASRRHARDSR